MAQTLAEVDRKIDELFGLGARDDVEGILATPAPDPERDIVGWWPSGPTLGREGAPFLQDPARRLGREQGRMPAATPRRRPPKPPERADQRLSNPQGPDRGGGARLVKEGRKLSLGKAAGAVLVSGATAYRYLPSVEAPLVGASFGLAVPDGEALFAGDPAADPEERVDPARAALRLMLGSALTRAPERPADEAVPPRRNRRTPLIEAAATPSPGPPLGNRGPDQSVRRHPRSLHRPAAGGSLTLRPATRTPARNGPRPCFSPPPRRRGGAATALPDVTALFADLGGSTAPHARLGERDGVALLGATSRRCARACSGLVARWRKPSGTP